MNLFDEKLSWMKNLISLKYTKWVNISEPRFKIYILKSLSMDLFQVLFSNLK